MMYQINPFAGTLAGTAYGNSCLANSNLGNSSFGTPYGYNPVIPNSYGPATFGAGAYGAGIYSPGVYSNGIYGNGVYGNGVYGNGVYGNGVYSVGAPAFMPAFVGTPGIPMMNPAWSSYPTTTYAISNLPATALPFGPVSSFANPGASYGLAASYAPAFQSPATAQTQIDASSLPLQTSPQQHLIAQIRLSRPFYGVAPKGFVRDDSRIQEEICTRIMSLGEFDPTDLEVSCAKGEVTLEGTCEHRIARTAFETICWGVSGVRMVKNQLRARVSGFEETHLTPIAGFGATGTEDRVRARAR